MSETEIKTKIHQLNESLTGEMFSDMETKEEIHQLEMKLKGVKPESSYFECVGCGS